MRYFTNMVDAVGRTPLVKLQALSQGSNLVLGKCEFFNPGGSIKDRIALSMLEKAEREGTLTSGTTVMEATSGNTGIGLAFACAVKGYPCTIIMPENMSIERRQLMQAYGATVITTPAKDGMPGAIEKLEKLKNEGTVFVPRQFENPANPETHVRTTAQEIWEDTEGRITHIIAGAGTGGTITGLTRELKRRNPSLQSVLVEPDESQVYQGGKPAPHGIPGISPGFIPEVLDLSIVDTILSVSSDDAKEWAKRLAREEGLLVGISAGAACAGAVTMVAREDDSCMVVILPDSGERYLSTGLYIT